MSHLELTSNRSWPAWEFRRQRGGAKFRRKERIANERELTTRSAGRSPTQRLGRGNFKQCQGIGKGRWLRVAGLHAESRIIPIPKKKFDELHETRLHRTASCRCDWIPLRREEKIENQNKRHQIRECKAIVRWVQFRCAFHTNAKRNKGPVKHHATTAELIGENTILKISKRGSKQVGTKNEQKG